MQPLARQVWTANVSAIAVALAMPAYAQTTEPAEADQPASSDEIVVSGIRSSLEDAINVKREADTIVDAISAEDAGKFPDTNIAESVQRITGVQINRTRGEGRTVNIRGLPQNFTLATLNGRSIANATVNSESAISRSFDFSLLPAEFIRTLEVYKAPTADIEDGGLSGVVNIRTPRPFDMRKSVISASAQGAWSANNGKAAPRLSAFFSDTFAEDRLGISFGIAYQQRRPETHAAVMNYTQGTEGNGIGGTRNVDLNGNGVVEPNLQVRYPAGTLFYMHDENSKRLSAYGSVQIRATDNLTLHFDNFYSSLDLQNIRNEYLNSFNTGTNVVRSGIEIQDLEGLPTATKFQVLNLDLRGNSRSEQRKGSIWSHVAGANWETDDGWIFTLEGGLSNSSQRLQNLNIATQARGTAAIAGTPGTDIVSVTYLDGFDQARLDPSSFSVLSINGEFNRRTEAKNNDARLDVIKEFDTGDFGITSFRFGGKYSYASIFQDNYNLNITPAGVSALYGGLPVGPRPGTFSAAPFMILRKASRGSFLDGYGGDIVFPTSWLQSSTLPFTSQFTDQELIAAGTLTNALTGVTDVREKKFAAYARADFIAGKLTGNIGLRYVNTRQQSSGATPDLSLIVLNFTSGNATFVPTSELVDVQRSYTNWLPSFNLKWQVTDELAVRFAASKTIARPNLGDIAPTTSVNANNQTITQDNPYLDPFLADNLDLTAEWYFAKGGLLGASLFYKDLKSLIRSERRTETLEVQVIRDINIGPVPENISFTFNQKQNGAGVNVKGVELFYQQAFTFLPSPLDGFGTQLNFTYIDNSDPTQLTAASKYNFNATAYYEKGPIGLRVSYAWRGKYLITPSNFPAMGVTREPFGTLDANLTLKLTDYAQLILEGSNLTDAAEVNRFTTGIPNIYQESGRRVTLGARIRL